MKKRFFVLLLAIVMITSSASAAGFKFAKLKLKDFTDEELCQMIDACNEKLYDHGFMYTADGPVSADEEPIKLYAGVYTVGEDVPAGTYRIEYEPFYGTVSFTIAGTQNFWNYVFSSSQEAIIGKVEMMKGDKFNTDAAIILYKYGSR